MTEKGGSNPDIEEASLNVEVLDENEQTSRHMEVDGKESLSQDDKEHSSAESLNHVEDPHTHLGVEEPSEAPSPGEVLPERPLQLVRPDPTKHRKLELVAQNVKHLYHINTAVAVVAVVGKFHSGKSFLLNQLMGKPGTGFTIGPTVRPQTMGIWMWGKVHININRCVRALGGKFSKLENLCIHPSRGSPGNFTQKWILNQPQKINVKTFGGHASKPPY